jgi:hypothetical protein
MMHASACDDGDDRCMFVSSRRVCFVQTDKVGLLDGLTTTRLVLGLDALGGDERTERVKSEL